MKEEFPWYFLDSDKSAEELWATSTLSLDANVLLDLYRYHPKTRDALLSAIESFGQRIWLSRQSAWEFIKNRKRVIVDAADDLRKPDAYISDLEKSVSETIEKMRGLRVLPDALIETLHDGVKGQLANAKNAIEDERKAAPEYFKVDPVLDRIAKAFSGKIGTGPADIDAAKLEADRRIKSEIPPGYKDKAKANDGAFGDYLVWRELMEHIKETQKPAILVTSEQKEDWWERKSGRTLNARLELLEEFFNFSGQRILIYRTERFLEHYLNAQGKADPALLQEVRVRSTARQPALRCVHEVLEDTRERLVGVTYASLERPVRNFTSTFPAQGFKGLEVRTIARLSDVPANCPAVVIRSSLSDEGLLFVHVHSAEFGEILPVGDYVLELTVELKTDVDKN